MNVLILHSQYSSGAASGENRVVDDELCLLRNNGHSVERWAPSVGRGAWAEVAAGARTVWSVEGFKTARRLTASRRFDVMHVHNLFPNLSPAVLRANVPTVMTLHNFRLGCLPATLLRQGRVCEKCLGHSLWSGVIYGCYRASRPASAALAASISLHRAVGTFDQVTLFSAVSAFVRDKLAQGGLDPRRVRVRRNFAWPTARREGAGEYFLALGRLSEEKGLDTVVGNWASGVKLLVVGDGPQRRRLEAMARGKVEFRDAVRAEDVAPIVRSARALLVPSRWYEGSPRVVVEAFAAGVPVIASRIGGLPEHVDHDRSGLLVEPGDLDAWAAAVKRLEDGDTSERLGEGAHHAWGARFSPDIGLRSLEALYREAIEIYGLRS